MRAYCKKLNKATLLWVILLTGCRSLPNTWNGTWKLNRRKSEIPGPSVKIVATSDGWYQIDNGSYSYRFMCDGKPYPVVGNRTVKCDRADAVSIETIFIDRGRTFDDTKRELLSNGKVLQLSSVMTKPNGAQESGSETFVRLSGTSGFSGTWKNTSEPIRAPETLVTTVTRSTLRLDYPSLRQSVAFNLKGTDMPLEGGGSASAGTTLAAKPESRLTLATTRKQNGNVVNVGTLSLTESGRELVEEWWRPENPMVRSRLTYEKQ